jgi:hypothetical protein
LKRKGHRGTMGSHKNVKKNVKVKVYVVKKKLKSNLKVKKVDKKK